MGFSGYYKKILTIGVLILALIAGWVGVLTYTIVDYTHQNQRHASEDNDRADDDEPPVPEVPEIPEVPEVPEVSSLRLMCIGASITRGEGSRGGRGYRKQIRDALTSSGKTVNYVGFNRFGDWEDNDVEGYGAYRIRTITKNARQSVPALRPNLILVQVGTSDCFQEDDTENIGSRMRILADAMIDADPEATVILSTLVTTPDPDYEPCILSANTQIRQVADDMIRENKTVALAEMHYDQGLPDRPKPEDIGPDRIHPTDEGYSMMGDIFLEKIREIEEKGFLQPPFNNSIPDNGDDGREVEDELKAKAEAEHPITKGSRRRRYVDTT
ncbi:SGNH hydrolase-type esterase domain-containing protein [Xylaria bambusicola]|uniref:SGNH hydrolase-type esterase domain-containing protein n=1 Tax=Xylaria bambusicola TaxID=326684 RepID=UPI0020078EB3|nr:SGNH hydrolase-type esterase domain-containing protein [Xylaria bambusicola]KAI0525638.1 SGNH hydrolase-type esterase domain-containing protein [Xylaria bambusicola]